MALAKDILTAEELSNYTEVSDFHFFTPEGIESALDESNKLTLKNLIFKGPIFFKGNFECEIYIQNCFFEHGAFIADASLFTEDVSFFDCDFNSFLKFSGDAIFKKNLNLFPVSVENFYLENVTFAGAMFNFKSVTMLYLEHATFKDIRISFQPKTRIERIKMNAQGLSGYLGISGFNDVAIMSLDVWGGSDDLALVFESLSVHRFYFVGYHFGKNLKLSNIKQINSNYPSEFLIGGSNLGKAEFYAVDLSEFQLVSIFDTSLTDAIFIGVKWPKYFHYYGYGGSSGGSPFTTRYMNFVNKFYERVNNTDLTYLPEIKHIYTDKYSIDKIKETFRQIKICYYKQGDVTLETKFHALEMTNVFKLSSFKRDGIQYLIVGFSYLFSDFGQSLTRPLKGLFFVHAILFFLLILFGNLPLTIAPSIHFFDWSSTIYYYAVLINPIRSIEYSGKSAAILIDITMRIWSSYMIFNFVRASRRFIK